MKRLALFLVLISFTGFSQTNLDSLWGVWNDQSQPDTSRLKAMQKISWNGYLFTQPDSAFYFAQMQYEFAKQKGLKKQMAAALNTQGASFYLQGDYAQAMDYYTPSLKIQEEIGDKQGMAISLGNIGSIYKNQGDFAQAIDYYTQSLKIQEEIGDKQGMASVLNNIGAIYSEQGDYAQAIDYYTRSLKIQEELGNKKGMAGSLTNIGVIYYEQGDYAQAMDYHTQSLKIEEEIGDKKGMAISLVNIGMIYSEQGDTSKAMDYYTHSLKINEEIGNKRGMANSLLNIGVIYYEQGETSKAIDYFTQSLKIQEEIGDKRGIALALVLIGNIYKDQGETVKALDYSSRALLIAKEVGAAIETKKAALLLWEINKKLDRHKDALEMYELYVSTRDSLESEENQKEVIRQEYKYEYEKQAAVDSIENAKQQKIAQATIEREKAENERKETVQYALFGGLGLVLVFAGFMFNRFRITRKQKRVIEDQKMKVDEAYEELDEKNTEILDSINYAKRIQSAILPPQKLVKEYLPDSFVMYVPKDIVAGDFYWMEHQADQILFAAADCTGHGVPGAMVSVVCNNGLNRSVREYGLKEPAKILDKTREIVIQEFEKSEEDVKDGMDIALVSLKKQAQSENESESESHRSLSPTDSILQYAGAHNPLWIIRNGASEIEEIKADKQPIGKFGSEQPFTNHTVKLQKGDTVYIFSDGFPDQFGGEKGKKFKSKNFKKLLLSITSEPMEKQRELIVQAFEDWKGSIEQLDDVCVIGVRL